MVSIARKNLFHDRLRLAIALVGIQFAVLLITIQIGVLLRFTTNASVLVDNIDMDLWITTRNPKSFDFGRPFNERTYYVVQGTPGIQYAEKYNVSFSFWKMPDGGQESVEVVGFNPTTRIGAPWDLVEGNLDDVKTENGVFIDIADRKRLGNPQVGDTTEIRGVKVRICGIVRGAKSFTQSPYVFTAYKNIYKFSFIPRGQVVYVLAKVKPGYSVAEAQRLLQKRLPYLDVYTKRQFSNKSRYYWMVTTGAGIALLSTACLGLIIGTVIVGQTIYASTIEHTREFGTLKAIGASNGDIYRIIIEQALITSVIGYVIAMALSVIVIRLIRAGGLDVLLPWQVLVGIFFLTVIMCIGSSIISIFKVTKIDPALIFKQ